MLKHTGGCHCGAIKFSTELDPMMVGKCNCNRCRRLFGTLAIGVFYAEDEITIEGDISSYGFEGGSGMPVTTHFCNKCGCRIFGKADSFPGMITMVLGAFDDPHAFKPKGEIYTNYKLNWLKDDGCIQESFEEAVVEERLMALLTGLEDR